MADIDDRQFEALTGPRKQHALAAQLGDACRRGRRDRPEGSAGAVFIVEDSGEERQRLGPELDRQQPVEIDRARHRYWPRGMRLKPSGP